ncbi:MAG TPA: DsbA family protein [Advenella sp.]|nr:DsbA family protein [Advenella sp.]
MKITLHYIYDPLCGWCYAAEPLLERVLASPLRKQIAFEMHAGGLFQRMTLPPGKRAMIGQADARIASMTGQRFGQPYLEGLLARDDTVYDSLPPIAAILASGAICAGTEPAMLQAIQYAHYREGRAVVQDDVLADLAQSLQIDRALFIRTYREMLNDGIQAHLDNTLRLMHYAGAQGFPAFVIQKDDVLEKLEHERYYGDAAGFASLVEDKIGRDQCERASQ